MENLPREVWKSIFLIVSRDFGFLQIDIRERTFRCICCVCALFSEITHSLVPLCFPDCTRSDWLLSHLTHLSSLDLSDNPSITETAFKNLSNLTSLRLGNNTMITDTARFYLTNLTELSLFDQTSLTDTSLLILTNLKKLHLPSNKSIHLTDTSVSTLTNLTSLSSRYNWLISDKSIGLLQNLTVLDISAQISDNSLINLTRLKSLKICSIFNGGALHISNRSLRTLTQLTHLSLCSKTPKITDESIEMLENLTDLDLTNNYSISFEAFRNHTRITALNLEKWHHMPPEGLINFPNLTCLNISLQSRNISNEWFSKLSDDSFIHLTKLRYLNLNYQERDDCVTDKSFKNLTQLTHLSLRGNTVITDEGLSHLVNLNTLDLNMRHTSPISNKGLSVLTNLTHLNLSKEKDTKKCLISDASLKNLKQLVSLDISHNYHITQEGISGLLNLTEITYCSGQFPESFSFSTLTKLTRVYIDSYRAL